MTKHRSRPKLTYKHVSLQGVDWDDPALLPKHLHPKPVPEKPPPPVEVIDEDEVVDETQVVMAIHRPISMPEEVRDDEAQDGQGDNQGAG